MKLRSLVLPCALALAASAWADPVVSSGQTLGLMNVPSTAANTMIAVPWLNVGGGDVKVCDLVKTDTLTAGDQLYYYTGSAYQAWTLSAGKAWEPITTVGTKDGMSTAIPAADQTIARGKALWLVRANTSAEIWVYGQYASTAAQTSVTAGTSETPVYSMVANPLAADFDLNTKNIEGASGDQIVFPGDSGLADTYTYNGTDWTRQEVQVMTVGGKNFNVKKTVTTGCVIPAGKGAWYVSKGGSPTISWN